MLKGAITSDIDTLQSIYKGVGCRRSGGYTGIELRVGLENYMRFLESYGINSTLFMVGNDFLDERNHAIIRDVCSSGHEIANHTMTHAQGFRLLSVEEKEHELSEMERVCEAVAGSRPSGFRSPGWNVGDDAMAILKRRGYSYDSSVFPTSLMPLLKTVHWYKNRRRSVCERSTMGQLGYMFSPLGPYRVAEGRLGRRGESNFIEFPISVSPHFRMPLTATFTLLTGIDSLKKTVRLMSERGYPMQYQFHLSDFVDYSIPELSDQVPRKNDGAYVPDALNMPLQKKVDIFKAVMEELTKYYRINTLKVWADDCLS